MINTTINIPCVLLIKVELKLNILIPKVSPTIGTMILNINSNNVTPTKIC